MAKMTPNAVKKRINMKTIIIIVIAIVFSVICVIGLASYFNVFDMPRYSTEFEMKGLAETLISFNSHNFYEKNNYYPSEFSYLTNTELFIDTFNYLKDKHFEHENKNVLNDIYYRPGSNWFELGYFIIKPGKKKAIISSALYKSRTNYIVKTIELDAANFYKTNMLFKKGIFNKE